MDADGWMEHDVAHRDNKLMNIKQCQSLSSTGSVFSCLPSETSSCSSPFPPFSLRLRSSSSTSPITLFLQSSMAFEVHTRSSPTSSSEKARRKRRTSLSPTRSRKWRVRAAVGKAMWNYARSSSSSA